MIIDTHSHIVDEKITKTPNDVVETFFSKGGDLFFAISTNIEDCKQVIETSKQYEKVIPLVGIHPHFAKDMDDSKFVKLEEYIQQAKGIGEIGLDYYYEFSDKQKQKEVFIKQLELAKKYNLPINIHTRDATEDTLNILKQFKGIKGIIHCFSGSKESAKEYIKLGYYLGIGGVVTFKKSEKIKEVVKEVGLDHIVLETDSPYLSPEPYRGTENESFNVTIIAQYIANLLETSIEEVYKKTTENVFNVFNNLIKEKLWK